MVQHVPGVGRFAEGGQVRLGQGVGKDVRLKDGPLKRQGWGVQLVPEVSGDLLDVIMGGQYCEQHGVRDVVKAREDLPLLVEVLGEGPLAELELLREVGQCSGLGRLSAVTTLNSSSLVL